MMPDLAKIFAWLAAVDPRLPGVACALIVLAVFLLNYAVRKLFPDAWEWAADLLPFLRGDVGPVLRALRKFWQALPSVIQTAALTALVAGGSVKAAVLGAVLGAAPPVLHELGKWCPIIPYKGAAEVTRDDPNITLNESAKRGTD